MNPSLSLPLVCDNCQKEHRDFDNYGKANFTEVYSDGEYDYCLDCFPKGSDVNQFQKISVYERIGKANLETGYIETILQNLTLPNTNDIKKKKDYIPESQETDSQVYKFALLFYKDIYSLSDPEFNKFKQLLLDSKLDCFVGNTISSFKIGPDKILDYDIISLNIVNAVCICPERGEGRSDFKVSINRDGYIGAFTTYGIYETQLEADELIEPLESIHSTDIKPDDLID